MLSGLLSGVEAGYGGGAGRPEVRTDWGASWAVGRHASTPPSPDLALESRVPRPFLHGE